MLEGDPEWLRKVQARVREQGVSFDVYLRGLIEPKRTDSEENDHLSPQERVRLLREWESSHNTNSRFFVRCNQSRKHLRRAWLMSFLLDTNITINKIASH